MVRRFAFQLFITMVPFITLLPFRPMAMVASALSQPQQGQRSSVVIKSEKDGKEISLYDESHALVIGVSKYKSGWRDLPGVRDDMKAVSELFERQGFKVEKILDPTRDEMDQAIRRFIARRGYKARNRLVIYFAGHGETRRTSDGRDLGYIVPADAPLASVDPIEFNEKAISMDEIDARARKIESKHALFIFDSCFSGSIFESRDSGNIPPAIESMIAGPVRYFITSGTQNQRVPDKSVFRRYLVRAFDQREGDLNDDGYITGQELGTFLRGRVSSGTRGAQTPQYGKITDAQLNIGDVVFELPRYVVPSAPSAPAPMSGEQAYWNVIATGADPSEFEDFIKKYCPQGIYCDAAKATLRRLQRSEKRTITELPKPKPSPIVLPRVNAAKLSLATPTRSILGNAATMSLTLPTEAIPPPPRPKPSPATLPQVNPAKVTLVVITPPASASTKQILLSTEGAIPPPPRPKSSPIALPGANSGKVALAVVTPPASAPTKQILPLSEGAVPPPPKRPVQLPSIRLTKSAGIIVPTISSRLVLAMPPIRLMEEGTPPPPPVIAGKPIPNPAENKSGVNTATVTVTAEESYWNSVSNSENPQDFETYLKRYCPQGLHCDVAEARFNNLTERKRVRSGGTATPSSPPSNESLLKRFSFTTGTADSRGRIKDRRQLEARVLLETIAPDVSFEMVEIPAGNLQISVAFSPKTVEVNRFLMSKFEITQAQWLAVSKLPKVRIELNPSPSSFKGENLPVEQVSWSEATEFCARLTALTGRKYFLPTEAQWEYACRAGTSTEFYFGNKIAAETANFDAETSDKFAQKGIYRKRTAMVGTIGLANGFGLFDMHGNVAEWCSSLKGDPDNSRSLSGNLEANDLLGDRAARGGSWYTPATDVRSGSQKSVSPTARSYAIGFRVVCDIQQ